MSKIQDKLKLTLEEIQRLKRVEKHFTKISEDLEASYDELDRLADKLEKEHNDLKQLENLSMKSLFLKVLGSKEEQIEKERQDYLQASLKYNEFKKTVEILEYEKNLLEKKLGDIGLLENKLKTLTEQRESELMKSGTIIGKKLLVLHNDIDQLELRFKEFSEAVSAGKKAIQMVEKMTYNLEKARDWGNWDMMGKGRMASYNKHSAIDRAREASYNAKYLLDRFQQELYDLGSSSYNFNLSINNLQNFTDVFFDNLISDWIMQQKIKNALSNVYSVRDKIIRILQSLKMEEKEIKETISRKNKEKKRLILSS
jgi:hypothetical protein